MHAQQALHEFDAVLYRAVALRFVTLRLDLEDFHPELTEHERP